MKRELTRITARPGHLPAGLQPLGPLPVAEGLGAAALQDGLGVIPEGLHQGVVPRHHVVVGHRLPELRRREVELGVEVGEHVGDAADDGAEEDEADDDEGAEHAAVLARGAAAPEEGEDEEEAGDGDQDEEEAEVEGAGVVRAEVEVDVDAEELAGLEEEEERAGQEGARGDLQVEKKNTYGEK